MNNINDMLKLHTWAVVGATDNKDKFGYKIYKEMKDKGLAVYPVNPGVDEILGDKCYQTLRELPTKPEAVDLVVPPRVGEKIIRECAELGIKNIWFQPGTASKELIKLAMELDLTIVQGCIMVELRK